MTYISDDPFAPQSVQPEIQNNQPSYLSPSEEKQVDTVEQALQQTDVDFHFTQDIRKQVAMKLLPTVLSMDVGVDEKSDPDLIQAKARHLDTLRGVLNDMDTANKNRTNMKLKQKDVETNAQQAINAAEFLRSIKTSDGTGIGMIPGQVTIDISADTVASNLEKQFSERGCLILDTELEAAGNMLPVEEPDGFDSTDI